MARVRARGDSCIRGKSLCTCRAVFVTARGAHETLNLLGFSDATAAGRHTPVTGHVRRGNRLIPPGGSASGPRFERPELAHPIRSGGPAFQCPYVGGGVREGLGSGWWSVGDASAAAGGRLGRWQRLPAADGLRERVFSHRFRVGRRPTDQSLRKRSSSLLFASPRRASAVTSRSRTPGFRAPRSGSRPRGCGRSPPSGSRS